MPISTLLLYKTLSDWFIFVDCWLSSYDGCDISLYFAELTRVEQSYGLRSGNYYLSLPGRVLVVIFGMCSAESKQGFVLHSIAETLGLARPTEPNIFSLLYT